MNTFHTIRHGALALFFVLVTVLGVTGTTAAAQGDAAVDKEVSGQCTFFHYVGGPSYIDEACAMAVRTSQVDDTSADEAVTRFCSFFHDYGGRPYIDEACAVAVREAAEEAAGWPNHNTTAMIPVQDTQETAGLTGVEIP